MTRATTAAKRTPSASATKSRPGNAGARSRSIYSAVFDELQAGIRLGRWAPGERLPSIAALAKDFRVGTGSMREALQSLQSIGLVSIEHGRGVFVTNPVPGSSLSSQIQRVSAGQMVALAETRRILEPELAALAAERGTDTELAEIVALARQMEDESRHGGDYAELDVAFHLQIARAARNPILDLTIEGVSDSFRESRRRISMPADSKLRTAQYHSLIAEALHARNAPQVRLLMQAHMNDMMRDVLAAEAKARPVGE